MRIEDHDLKELITKDPTVRPSTELVEKVLQSLPLNHPSTPDEQLSVVNGSGFILGRGYKSMAPLLLLLFAGVCFLVISPRYSNDEDLHHVDTLSLSTLLIL
jgi:hypothetical protein